MRILVFCEAAWDLELYSTLAERILREEGPAWLADLLEAGGLQWTATTWKEVKPLAQRRGLRSTGRGGAGAAKAHKALQLATFEPDLEAVLLSHDVDRDEDLPAQFHEERNRFTPRSFEVFIATPDPESEAWILHGYEPRTAHESSTLENITRDLSFDPCREPGRLRGDKRRGDALRDIKEVLLLLTGNNTERLRSCVRDTPIQTLEDRATGRSGRTTRLGHYFDEIRQRLQPRLTGLARAKP